MIKRVIYFLYYKKFLSNSVDMMKSLLQFEINMKFKFSKFSRASRIDFLTGKKDRKRGGRAAIVNIHSKLGHHFSGGIWRAKDGISASDGPKRNS